MEQRGDSALWGSGSLVVALAYDTVAQAQVKQGARCKGAKVRQGRKEGPWVGGDGEGGWDDWDSVTAAAARREQGGGFALLHQRTKQRTRKFLQPESQISR